MGAQAAVEHGDHRWLTPLPLWTGILAGPLAWAFDLTTSYAVVKWACRAQNHTVFQVITLVSLLVVTGGAVVSFKALSSTMRDTPTDGGWPRQRAHFMAIVGLCACALFALQILAGAVPHWMLNACH